jgi:hypothetical protein
MNEGDDDLGSASLLHSLKSRLRPNDQSQTSDAITPQRSSDKQNSGVARVRNVDERARLIAARLFAAQGHVPLLQEVAIAVPGSRQDSSRARCDIRTVDGRVFELFEGQTLTFGRGKESATIPILMSGASRRHARIEWLDNRVCLTDLGSLYGTRIVRDSAEIQLVPGEPVRLYSNDRLEVFSDLVLGVVEIIESTIDS